MRYFKYALLLYFLTLSVSCTQNVSPPKTGWAAAGDPSADLDATEDKDTVFIDNFDRNIFGWPENSTHRIADGKYTISDTPALSLVHCGLDTRSDFSMEVTLSQHLSLSTMPVGILFYSEDSREAVVSFTIDGHGNRSFQVADGDTLHSYVDGVPTYFFDSNGINRIRIKKNGRTVQAFINDHPAGLAPAVCFEGEPELLIGKGADIYSVKVNQPVSFGRPGQSCSEVAHIRNQIDAKYTDSDSPGVVTGRMLYDRRYNYMWSRDTFSQWQQLRQRNVGLSWPAARDWVFEVNEKKYLGRDNWRLPTREELSNSFGVQIRKFTGEKIDGLNHPELEPGDLVMTRSITPDGQVLCMVVSEPREGYEAIEWEAVGKTEVEKKLTSILIATGPFDCFDAFHGKSQEARPWNDVIENKIKTAIDAYGAGLSDVGEMKMMALASQHPWYLYQARIWRRLLDHQMPLSVSGKVFQAVLKAEQNKPGFWFEYGHVAFLAGQPELAMAAADRSLGLIDRGFVSADISLEEARQMVLILKAHALSQMSLQKENGAPKRAAEKLLFSQSPYAGNSFVLPYLYLFGAPLFTDVQMVQSVKKNKGWQVSRLALGEFVVAPVREEFSEILGIPAGLLPGFESFRYRPEKQAFERLLRY